MIAQVSPAQLQAQAAMPAPFLTSCTFLNAQRSGRNRWLRVRSRSVSRRQFLPRSALKAGRASEMPQIVVQAVRYRPSAQGDDDCVAVAGAAASAQVPRY